MRKLLALTALVVVAAAAGYFLARGSEHAVSLGPPPGSGTGRSTGAQQTGAPAAARTIQVWFARDGRLAEALRTYKPTRKVATAALDALLAGPVSAERAAGLSSQIPSGTRLLGITIENGVANVDLSSDYESGADARTLQLRLAQVVYTLTQFPTVSSVRFSVEGTPVNVFSSGGIVLDHPVGRSAYSSLAPQAQPLAGSWRALPPAPLQPLASRLSVWTGHELLVLGRLGGEFSLASYDPRTDSWRLLASPPRPARAGPYRIAWTGRALLLWGLGVFDWYSPRSGRWHTPAQPPTAAAPVVAAWTGNELLGWTGSGGAAYDQDADTWRALPPAPVPARPLSTGAWTGRELVVVSGARAAAYRPGTDRWRRLPNLPAARPGARAVWDGNEVLVVGGSDAPQVGYGYDPDANRWRTLSPMGSGRAHSAVVWSGRRLLLWGGLTRVPGGLASPPNGLAYDPLGDVWRPLPQAPLRGRNDPAGAWTGRSLIVWGGGPGLEDGAAFTPSG